MNYFTLFGLPVHHQIDIKKLSHAFHNLQRQHHPDKFINSTKLEQLAATNQSAIINQAWKTLRDPIERIEYFLSLKGYNIEKENTIIQDRIFLSTQLELYEELNILEQKKDKKKIKIFIERVKDIYFHEYEKISQQLGDKKWNLAMNSIRKLRFLNKLIKDAENCEEKLFYF